MRGYWEEIGSLEQRMDDLLHTVFGKRARLAYPALPLFVARPFVPAVDVLAREGNLVVRVELPGVDPAKDIRVSTEKGELTIIGERRHEEEVEEGNYYRMEGSYGAFERRIPIPEGIDEGGRHHGHLCGRRPGGRRPRGDVRARSTAREGDPGDDADRDQGRVTGATRGCGPASDGARRSARRPIG